MNPYWTAFIDDVPWFLAKGARVTASDAAPPGSWSSSATFARAFPTLDHLLRSAHVSDVVIDEQAYTLFSWPGQSGTPAWLCASPPEPVPAAVCTEHRLLLESFGGVVERAEEPESWLLNHTEALTASEAGHDASFLANYAWAFPDGKFPIDMSAYYSIAREANGNTTLCHRHTGGVLLFAPDHSFDHVRPLRGCPEYTLYELRDAATFREWVEIVAAQWLDAVADDRGHDIEPG